MRRTILWLASACVVGSMFAVLTRANASGKHIDCVGTKRAIVVDTKAHRLALCEDGKSVETFDVRLGRNGVGKTREGDGKTPLGRYLLGEPRGSAKYTTFVPVGYPTEAQPR